MIRRLAACIGLLLLWWGTSCRHAYQRHQTATRTEETTSQWQTDTSAVENKQSTETKRTVSKRVVEKFRPDGTLLERMTEQADEDRRLQTEVASASQSTAGGTASRSVAASSSRSTKADTRAGWPSWWWALLIIPLAVVAWALRRYVLPRIPWKG